LQYDAEIEGRRHQLVVTRTGGGFAVAAAGRTWHVDAARIDGHLLSLVIGEVSPKGDTAAIRKSYEVAVWQEPGSDRISVGLGSSVVDVTLNGRRRRKDEGGHEGVGPQRLLAPMPGKIVRILVKTGDVVRPRQGLVVVEAMKMENELRAAGDGTVVEIHVREGASVESGALLVVIA